MSDSRDEMRAAAMFEAEGATGNGELISRALHRRELTQKDAAIKALADALVKYAPRGPEYPDEVQAALRLVGRLP